MVEKKFVKCLAVFIIFFILETSIAGCSRQSVSSKNRQTPTADNQPGGVNSSQDGEIISKQDPKATVSLSDGRIKLYPYTEKDDMYTSYILEIDGKQRRFPWRNIADTMWNPRLYLNNIDGDDGEELVVILILGEGTGVYIEEARVINPGNLGEIDVENPLDAIKERVKTQVIKKPNGGIIRLCIDGQVEDIQVTDKDLSDSVLWNVVAFQNQIRFRVTNNKLVAFVGAQVSMTATIGDIVITYDYDHNLNAYRASKIEFNHEQIK